MTEIRQNKLTLSTDLIDMLLQHGEMGAWEWKNMNQEDEAFYWTDNLYRIYGRDPALGPPNYLEAVSRIHPDDKDRVLAAYQEHLVKRTPLTIEYRNERDSGGYRWLIVTGQAKWDENGVPLSMVGVILDATDKKQTEEEFRTAMDFLTKVEDWSEMGTVMWYSSRNQFWLSKGASKVLGIERSRDITLEDLVINVHKEDRESVLERLREFPGPEGYRIEFRTVNNGIHHMELNTYHFSDPLTGERILSGVLRDVTGPKERLEAIAALNSDLQRSNQELEHFAYVASHDLQEPLRKIQTFGERLSERAVGLDERSLDYLDRMLGATSRMQLLIQNLLDFSRVTRNEGQMVMVDLNLVLDKVCEDLGTRISDTGARVDVDDRIPPVVGHQSQLYRLFMNLLSNALKFIHADRKPEVAILSKVVSSEELDARGVALNGNRRFVQISVADNGIGFDEQYLEKIFGLFQRLHGRAEYEGTGIGLAMCQRIAMNHGGYITAESTEGEGSTFHLFLPLIKQV